MKEGTNTGKKKERQKDDTKDGGKKRIEQEKENLEAAEKRGDSSTNTKQGFAERRSK